MCKDEMRVRHYWLCGGPFFVCSAKHNASILSMNDQTSLFHANHTSMFFWYSLAHDLVYVRS